MPTPIVIPELGNAGDDVLILEWLKSPGDEVTAGEVLLQLDTDKATVDIESPASGTLLAILREASSEVPQHTVVGVIGEPGDDISGFAPSQGQGARDAVPRGGPESRHAHVPASVPTGSVAGVARPGVSPRAARLADELGIDVGGVSGSGPQGRIIERDVLAGSPSGAGGDARHGAVAAAAGATAQTGIEAHPVVGTRRVIAERMLDSLHTTAQLTLHRTVDATGLFDAMHRTRGDATPGAAAVTLSDLIHALVVRALQERPGLNALLDEGVLYRHAAVHLAFAIDTPGGLLAPVIRNAHRMSLAELASERQRLSAACLEGSVSPDELGGGTFTVSNLGPSGVEYFTPILNPPQVAILGVGAVTERTAVDPSGTLQMARQIPLSLTIDHQVVDGAPGAAFLATLAHAMENAPELARTDRDAGAHAPGSHNGGEDLKGPR